MQGLLYLVHQPVAILQIPQTHACPTYNALPTMLPLTQMRKFY